MCTYIAKFHDFQLRSIFLNRDKHEEENSKKNSNKTDSKVSLKIIR